MSDNRNEAPAAEFAADVRRGLSAAPRSIPCKYLYDARGSELFEAICRTGDYYVTRADLALHEAHLADMAAAIGPGAHVIEFGSGAGVKTRRLLAGLDEPRAYTPIEISASALKASTRELQRVFPEIEIRPLRADYTRPIPESAVTLDPPAKRRVIYFPGSTISNFTHDEARDFLARMANIVGPKGGVIIGVDLIKSRQRLLAAYDDSNGVTAAFNLNLLARMNRELGCAIPEDAFHHEARFNPDLKRVEMHLVADRDLAVSVDGESFPFRSGDTIHTENSHKYSVKDFRELAERAGLQSKKVWKDPEGLFSTHYLVPARTP